MPLPADSDRQRRAGYRPDIDGLRGLAILSVVLFHAGVPGVRGGFVGVDVFFVISGYLISNHLYRETTSGRFTLHSFYVRRARRILPALFLVLAFCYIAAILLLGVSEMKRFVFGGLATLLSVSNIEFYRSLGYFTPAADLNPLLMTWSLGVEEQFYLLFPWLMLLLRRSRGNAQLLALGLLSLLSFLWCLHRMYSTPTAAFYLLPSRGWELGIGALLGVWEASHPDHDAAQHGGAAQRSARVFQEFLSVLGLACLAVAVLGYDNNTPFPGRAALLPVFGSAFVIRARDSWINRRVWAWRPLVGLGLVSYSWYLWHWPLLSFARICTVWPLSIGVSVGAVTVALGMAVLSYRSIEQPFRRGAASPGILLRYFGMSAALAVPLLFLGVTKGWPSRYPVAAKVDNEATRQFSIGCLAGYGMNKPIGAPLCEPAFVGRQAVVVLGDSHAAALGATLREQAQQHGWMYAELTKMSCPPLEGVSRRMASYPAHEVECARYNAEALRYVLASPSAHTVVLAGLWSSVFDETATHGGYTDLQAPQAPVTEARSWALLGRGLASLVATLQQSGKEVFIVEDFPVYPFDPLPMQFSSVIPARHWVQRHFAIRQNPGGSLARDEVMTAAQRRAAAVVTEVAKATGVRLLRPVEGLCSTTFCRYEDAGVPLYHDASHLSLPGSRLALQGQSIF